ncbi:unnamed protein product, partial [marine sediment metagenome]
PIAIDGYNVLITIEAAMSDGIIFKGRDGCFRDLASIHGTYRKVTETIPAVQLIGQFLKDIGVTCCLWLLDSPDPNHRNKLEQNLLAAMAKQPRQIKIWRTIMKNRITKLATAAVIILIAVLGITLLEKSATPAWAIEQTIEVLKRYSAAHISGVAISEDGLPHSFELWARANEDHTQSRDFKSEADTGQVLWVQGNDTYNYDPNQNTVHIRRGERAQINPWLGRDLLQTLERYTNDWQVSYGNDPATGRERVFVTCSHPHAHAGGPKSWRFEFDLETKLPVRFKEWHNLQRKGKPDIDVQK